MSEHPLAPYTARKLEEAEARLAELRSANERLKEQYAELQEGMQQIGEALGRIDDPTRKGAAQYLALAVERVCADGRAAEKRAEKAEATLRERR